MLPLTYPRAHRRAHAARILARVHSTTPALHSLTHNTNSQTLHLEAEEAGGGPKPAEELRKLEVQYDELRTALANGTGGEGVYDKAEELKGAILNHKIKRIADIKSDIAKLKTRREYLFEKAKYKILKGLDVEIKTLTEEHDKLEADVAAEAADDSTPDEVVGMPGNGGGGGGGDSLRTRMDKRRQDVVGASGLMNTGDSWDSGFESSPGSIAGKTRGWNDGSGPRTDETGTDGSSNDSPITDGSDNGSAPTNLLGDFNESDDIYDKLELTRQYLAAMKNMGPREFDKSSQKVELIENLEKKPKGQGFTYQLIDEALKLEPRPAGWSGSMSQILANVGPTDGGAENMSEVEQARAQLTEDIEMIWRDKDFTQCLRDSVLLVRGSLAA